MNVSYKHLDTKLRIAELTVGQWLAVLIGVALGIVWGLYVSPFGPTITLTVAIYLAALPCGAALLASATEVDPFVLIRSAIAWRRLRGHFAPGPGRSASGYVVKGEARADGLHGPSRYGADPDLPFLWEDGR
ncbi:MAG TPA: hypothetical protein VGG40_05360 [Solirubrobacterales bacterium]|jgi:hypothetical protein